MELLPGEAPSRGSATDAERYRGPLGLVEDGRRYHGDLSHRFSCWPFGKPFDKKFQIVSWDPRIDSVDDPEVFCGHFGQKGADDRGTRVFECLGHDVAAGVVQAAAGIDVPVMAGSSGDAPPPLPPPAAPPADPPPDAPGFPPEEQPPLPPAVPPVNPYEIEPELEDLFIDDTSAGDYWDVSAIESRFHPEARVSEVEIVLAY